MAGLSVGTRFLAAYADSNSLWEVKGRAGKGVWFCEIVHDGSICDWVGTTKTFTTKEISSSIELERSFAESMNENEKFLQSQPEGRILHYHNGFGAYVRNVVVIHEGRRKLKPIGLVGNWSQYDLPYRYANGEVAYSYHVREILDGTLSEGVQISTIYEHPKFFKPRSHRGADKIDPRSLPLLSLELPDPTEDEKKTQKLWQIIDSVRDTLGGDDPQQILRSIYDRLSENHLLF